MQVRDRIREFRRIPAASLRPNPKNWRVHPERQRNALMGVLAEVGYADALLVRECADGSFELIDGHLRAETTPDQPVPVLILDVDEREAALLLASVDPLANLAETDGDQLSALLQELDPQSPALQEMFADLSDAVQAASQSADDGDSETTMSAADQSDLLRDRFEILVECSDEQDQAELLERLQDEGYSCRALIA